MIGNAVPVFLTSYLPIFMAQRERGGIRTGGILVKLNANLCSGSLEHRVDIKTLVSVVNNIWISEWEYKWSRSHPFSNVDRCSLESIL